MALTEWWSRFTVAAECRTWDGAVSWLVASGLRWLLLLPPLYRTVCLNLPVAHGGSLLAQVSN